ncbi:hypothetical protein [Tessaracoccus coleopterorum]|uniref:hypothetical protein n=1 Tax=Tessaracoccus coleopterorum TaxID=2714950 RepID=UPI002F915D9B
MLGLTVLGSYASEMIWGASVVLETELNVTDLRQVVFPHPPSVNSSERQLGPSTPEHRNRSNQPMPRNLIVDPSNVRARSVITAPEIPVNAYVPNFEKELETYGKQGLVDILHDMIAVRQFETMLNSIKTTGAWNGVEYNHRGPRTCPSGRSRPSSGRPRSSIRTTSCSARTGATARSSPSATRLRASWRAPSSRTS